MTPKKGRKLRVCLTPKGFNAKKILKLERKAFSRQTLAAAWPECFALLVFDSSVLVVTLNPPTLPPPNSYRNFP